jgi:hypothetical protein
MGQASWADLLHRDADVQPGGIRFLRAFPLSLSRMRGG